MMGKTSNAKQFTLKTVLTHFQVLLFEVSEIDESKATWGLIVHYRSNMATKIQVEFCNFNYL